MDTNIIETCELVRTSSKKVIQENVFPKKVLKEDLIHHSFMKWQQSRIRLIDIVVMFLSTKGGV